MTHQNRCTMTLYTIICLFVVAVLFWPVVRFLSFFKISSTESLFTWCLLTTNENTKFNQPSLLHKNSFPPTISCFQWLLWHILKAQVNGFNWFWSHAWSNFEIHFNCYRLKIPNYYNVSTGSTKWCVTNPYWSYRSSWVYIKSPSSFKFIFFLPTMTWSEYSRANGDFILYTFPLTAMMTKRFF